MSGIANPLTELLLLGSIERDPPRATTIELARYAARRDRLCRNPQSPSFFLSEKALA